MKIIKSQNEIMTQELIEKIFKKAKNESGQDTSHGLSKHLEEVFDETNIRLKLLTFERYFTGYIQDGKRIKPNTETKNALSKYLGYVDFVDFCEKNKCLKEKKKVAKMLFWSLLVNLLLLLVSIFYFTKYNEENCMVWVDDHYEKVKCSGEENQKKLDIIELENFKKVEVCRDSTFIIDGEAVIHYTRHKNSVDFFTDEGEHPIYEGVYTDPITQTIIDSRVKPCDSIENN
jgi:hypothetical protein